MFAFRWIFNQDAKVLVFQSIKLATLGRDWDGSMGPPKKSERETGPCLMDSMEYHKQE